jgi:hypothetical protein
MKLLLITDELGENHTFGKLYIDGEFMCDTLEDKTRDINGDGRLELPKVWGKTAIPYGTCEVTLIQSPHFKRLVPLLCGVPGFTGIEMHPGNKIEDTNGCILVGERDEKNHTLKGGTSTKAFDKIMTKLIESKQTIFHFEKRLTELV